MHSLYDILIKISAVYVTVKCHVHFNKKKQVTGIKGRATVRN